MAFFCREDGSGVVFKVHLSPRASKDGIDGCHGDALKIKVKAPPVEGKANEALIKFLAKLLGVPQNHLDLIHGRSGRTKTLRVEGLNPEEVVKRLDGR